MAKEACELSKTGQGIEDIFVMRMYIIYNAA